MIFVASTEDTPGGIVTTNPGEQMQINYALMEDMLLAEAVVEVSKDKEMTTAVVVTVIEMLGNIISNL
jgi:hypothetical protein